MDPVSFALAIAGVPGMFKNSVECFEYIQFGRNFGSDFGICSAKLEGAEMRLSRWGESMGLFVEPIDPDALFKKGNWKEKDIEKAKEWLGLILGEFETAKTRSDNFQRISSKPADLEVINEETELTDGDPLKKLIADMRRVVISRKKQTSIGKKIKWAVHSKGQFEVLIENICILVNNLTELFPFPALVARQTELCKEEVKGIDQGSISVLIEILGEHDKLLNKVLAGKMKNEGLVFNNVVIDTSGFARLGNTHEYGSGAAAMNIWLDGLKVGGTGESQIGHLFGGLKSSNLSRKENREWRSPDINSP